MFSYTTFETDDSSFKLSAIIYNGTHSMPSLYHVMNGSIHDEVNSIDYLLEIYKYLSDAPDIDSDLIEDFESIYSSYKQELLEMFNEANKLGFFYK